ncbi:hypothetical protein [Parageobacillus galactosidasius]|uniref:Uncharacterized protein n=1 Tax=Parageobacillus galactosidasius TaxID=883812 RepID=A0A226QS06_9BACL|nr:hypothetical protein [Parageobacillus galactosidasius]OXB94814.1 hypothetical protein B9L23_08100 [Parageobacillus galactosidasius]
MGLVSSDQINVIFYDSETGKELLVGQTEEIEVVTNCEGEQKPMYELLLNSISGSIDINIKKPLYDFDELVCLLFGENHWLYKEIDRLTKIRNRTKNKRIKKKLEKRMFTEIFKEWKRLCLQN